MFKTVSRTSEPIRFKRFSRKGYALFACLGKTVLIGTLSVATLTHAKADGISTETDKATDTLIVRERSVMLDEVSVSGSRAPLTQGQAVRIVTVLSGNDIAAAPVQSVNDLLKYVASVDVRQRAPMGAQTDISIRGGTNEHIAILLNGINICDPQTGHNALDLPIDVSEIERIEILEGPAGRVYGTSSLVGAINIITKTHTSDGIDLHAEGGSFGYGTMGGAYTGTTGKWTYQASANYSRSDGYTRSAANQLNNDYEGWKAFCQGRYDDTALRLRWHAGYSSKGWGSNTSYSVKSDEQFEHTNKFYSAIQADLTSGALHILPSVYWNRNEDRYEFYRGQPDKVKYNYNRTDVFGLNINSYFDWQLGRTAFGAEARNEDLISGNLGETLDNPIHIHGTDRQYTLGLNRTNLSLYLEHNLAVRRLNVSVGLVAVKNTWNEMPFKVYPGLDASYRLSNHWRAFASYNTSLRMPSFTELYYSVNGYKADKYLKPEEMTSVEAGVKYVAEGVSGQLSVWHHHGKNMIDWIMDTSLGDEAVWESVNHSKVNSTGYEATARFDFLRLMPQQKVLRSLNVAYCYIDQDKKSEEGIVSYYALEYLRHKFTAGLQLGIVDALSLGLNYRYQYRIGSYTDTNSVTQRFHPYSMLDARLSWDKPQYSLYLEANNLLDATYVDYGNVPQPGTWVIVGAKWRINL